MVELPNGTVTLLFTDVEGSTQLLRRLGEQYGAALEDQRQILRSAVAEHGGTEIDSRGDELFAAFPRARAGLAAAVAAQRALAEHAWPEGETLRVRMGLHTGEPGLRDDGYLGLDVHRAARISAAAHGGQVLLSQGTRELAAGEGDEFIDLGEHALKDLPRPERLFQAVGPGLAREFPLPRTAAADLPAGRERELAAALTRPRRFLDSLRPTRRGFADLGWEVRALLPSEPPERRESLLSLGRELFDAARSADEVDKALAIVERKQLAQRLAVQREQSVLSKASAREAEVSERRLARLATLIDRRAASGGGADEVREWLRARAPADALERVTQDVRRTNQDLIAAHEEARPVIGSVGARLRRTHKRGVFRIGEEFVPFVDEVGVDRLRRFESLAEA